MKRNLLILMALLLAAPTWLKGANEPKNPLVGIWQLCIVNPETKSLKAIKVYKIFDTNNNVSILNDEVEKNCMGLITMQAKFHIQSDSTYTEDVIYNSTKAYDGARSLMKYHIISSDNNEFLCSSYPTPDKKHRIGEVWRRVNKAPQQGGSAKQNEI